MAFDSEVRKRFEQAFAKTRRRLRREIGNRSVHSSHASKTQDLAIKRETFASYIDLLVAAKVLYRPFRNVRDSWPCYLLTLDPLPEGKAASGTSTSWR